MFFRSSCSHFPKTRPIHLFLISINTAGGVPQTGFSTWYAKPGSGPEPRYLVYFMFAPRWVLGSNSTKPAWNACIFIHFRLPLSLSLGNEYSFLLIIDWHHLCQLGLHVHNCSSFESVGFLSPRSWFHCQNCFFSKDTISEPKQFTILFTFLI